MDDQLLRDALRTSTALPSHGTHTSAADIRAMGTRRRRRRHGMTGLAAFAFAVLLGAGWLSLPSGGAPQVLQAATGGASSERGAVVSAIGLVGVVALVVLVAVRAWTSRRSAGAWLCGGALLLSVGVVTGLCGWYHTAQAQGPSLSALVVVAVLVPNLVTLGAMVAMLGRQAGPRVPVSIVVAAVAVTGSVAYAFPNQNLRMWWDYAHSDWVFRLAAFEMLVALVLLVVGWLRGGATLRPGLVRRITALALLAVIAVASSLPWLFNVRELFDDSPTPLLVAGQVILLLIPGVVVVLGSSRRSTRRVIGAAAVTQLIVVMGLWVAVISDRAFAFLVLGYAFAFVVVGALMLWAASLVAIAREPADSGEVAVEVSL